MDIRSLGVYTPTTTKPSSVKKSGEKFSLSDSAQQVKMGTIYNPSMVTGVFAEADDLNHKRKRAFVRGKSLLSELDHLRIALLSGNISAQNLRNLELLLACDLADGLSCEERDVLLEIETRAAVELAKIRPS